MDRLNKWSRYMKSYILKSIKKLEKGIPIQWDRVSEGENYIVIYGWIKRKDGERDFVQYMIFGSMEKREYWDMYVTSSAKYTKQMAKNFRTIDNPCKKFEDWKKEA